MKAWQLALLAILLACAISLAGVIGISAMTHEHEAVGVGILGIGGGAVAALFAAITELKKAIHQT